MHEAPTSHDKDSTQTEEDRQLGEKELKDEEDSIGEVQLLVTVSILNSARV